MKPARHKLKRLRLSDQVIDCLITMIANGELQPGDKLPPEPQLMEQFGVGRSSIREAVGALELVGLVAVRPGDGTRLVDSSEVAESRAVGLSLLTIGHGAIRDLVEARCELEQSIAGYAAERATDVDRAAIKALHARMALSGGSVRAFLAADLEFHTAIATACHNSILFRLFAELKQPVRHWMEQKHRFDWGREQVVAEHEAIVQAIEARDADAARQSMRTHIKRAGDKLVAAMLGAPARG